MPLQLPHLLSEVRRQIVRVALGAEDADLRAWARLSAVGLRCCAAVRRAVMQKNACGPTPSRVLHLALPHLEVVPLRLIAQLLSGTTRNQPYSNLSC